ncbi:MAG: DUF4037 domain-containing protein [Candidatus Vogelbacteria bacterium]|nr:DUF4037 domain-containing protein [Candidatus Vogelbacteria bacterium]
MVKHILEKNFPGLKYSAGLMGWGSEVLGYDTAISRDHHFGPRVFIFLSEEDEDELEEKIKKILSDNLPYKFLGYSTNFSEPQPNGVRVAVDINSGPVNHMVDIFTIRSFFKMRLRIDPHNEISNLDWLTFSQQTLLEMVSGEVFYGGLGELNKIREKFKFYPKDIWLYMLASQWQKIAADEEFVGRCGDVGDEVGSQIVAARIVRAVMGLCFLMEKRYAPYSKWFGTAFARLDSSKDLLPILRKVLLSQSWRDRERYLSEAYDVVVKLHNELGITDDMPVKASAYNGRPYLVIHADKFADAIRKNIEDQEVKMIEKNFGSVDQFIDRMDILSQSKTLKKINIWFNE